MAAVRLDDYKLMQQTALKLNKLWGAGTTSAAAGGGSASSRYYLWVVMSVYLQVKLQYVYLHIIQRLGWRRIDLKGNTPL